MYALNVYFKNRDFTDTPSCLYTTHIIGTPCGSYSFLVSPNPASIIVTLNKVTISDTSASAKPVIKNGTNSLNSSSPILHCKNSQ